MTPKEKAKELTARYLGYTPTDFNDIEIGFSIYKAKKNALICVDEILTGSRLFYIQDYDYWKEVKKEIEKL